MNPVEAASFEAASTISRLNQMKTKKSIRQAFESKVKALEQHPNVGKGTAATIIRVRDGLTCDIEEGPWKLTADLSPKSGGAGLGPNPGVLGRAALGSCLAIEYLLWASRLEVPITALEVEVQTGYDSRGMYGFDTVPPGYRDITYIVRVESPASEEEVRQVLDIADRYSPYLDVFARPQLMQRKIEFLTSIPEP
jgi:uncharacterized OsmC-like protein